MKKLLILSLTALTLSVGVTSCKKGENDPFLSLSSRKARLAGEWVVSSEDVVSSRYGYDYVMGMSVKTKTDITSNYNGSTLTGVSTKTYIDLNTTSTDEIGPIPYTETYTFKKDGTFTHVTNNVDEVNTEDGTWMFLGKNKGADLKKKEAITLSVTKRTNAEIGGETTVISSTGFDGTVIVLDKLKKKEMTFIVESTDTGGIGTETYKRTTNLKAK